MGTILHDGAGRIALWRGSDHRFDCRVPSDTSDEVALVCVADGKLPPDSGDVQFFRLLDLRRALRDPERHEDFVTDARLLLQQLWPQLLAAQNGESWLNAIAGRAAACTRCVLAQGRSRVVPGEGSPRPDHVLFIGEAPGQREDATGQPFVGASGRLLSDLLGSIGLERSRVYIANVVKCRPPKNRDPLPEEIHACSEYLDEQLLALRPRVIVTLGRYSLHRFLPGASISQVHGQPQAFRDPITDRSVWILPLYHPAYGLYDPRRRPQLFSDIARLTDLLGGDSAVS